MYAVLRYDPENVVVNGNTIMASVVFGRRHGSFGGKKSIVVKFPDTFAPDNTSFTVDNFELDVNGTVHKHLSGTVYFGVGVAPILVVGQTPPPLTIANVTVCKDATNIVVSGANDAKINWLYSFTELCHFTTLSIWSAPTSDKGQLYTTIFLYRSWPWPEWLFWVVCVVIPIVVLAIIIGLVLHYRHKRASAATSPAFSTANAAVGWQPVKAN